MTNHAGMSCAVFLAICLSICSAAKGVTWDFYPAHSLLSAVKDSADRERTGDELTALLDHVFYYITQLEDIDYKESQEGSFDDSRTAHDKMAHGTRDSVLRHKIAQAHRSYFQTWKDVKTKEATKKGSQRERIIKVKDDVFGRLGNWTVLKAMDKLLDLIPSRSSRAKRICRPGPPIHSHSHRTHHRNRKHCLILGDSVSIGYTRVVKRLLRDDCTVHHAPWSGDGGSLDTGYILQCLPLFLSNSRLNPVKYDVIVLNAGLHDVNCCNFTEEFVPISTYAKNLEQIKKQILKNCAELVFATSTPIPFNNTLNEKVKRYNSVAKRVMHQGTSVSVLDLHKFVEEKCKGSKIVDCDIFQDQPNVHFTMDGYDDIGKIVASSLQQVLRLSGVLERKSGKQHKTSAPLLRDPPLGSMYCLSDSRHASKSKHVTGCPVNTTCCYNVMSHSLIGCCLLPGAMDCGDSWHCCARGTICDPSCTQKKCLCRKAPWESKAARITFSLLMRTLNKFWNRLTKKYGNFAVFLPKSFG